MTQRRDAKDRQRGATVLEMVVVLGILSAIVGLATPMSATVLDAGRARHAAGFVQSRFRLAKIEAVNKGANVGVVFDRINGEWVVRVCRDATRNGLRRAEIASGADPCFDGPHAFTALFPGVTIGVDPLLVGPGGEPGNPDAVRFGTSDIASFAPGGTCTSGSLFLRTARGQQYAIRVAGVNGRSRVFRFDAGAAAWVQP